MSEKKSVTETRIVEDPENIRRNFLKKFGKYAATVPAVTFTLMSPLSAGDIGSTGGGNS